MCKRKNYQIDRRAMATEGAYEGQTMRLDVRDLMQHERPARQVYKRHGSFPWWTLWLIWPLIGLVKWFAPLYMSAATAVFAQLGAAGAAPFVAIALIVVGLVLIRRG